MKKKLVYMNGESNGKCHGNWGSAGVNRDLGFGKVFLW